MQDSPSKTLYCEYQDRYYAVDEQTWLTAIAIIKSHKQTGDYKEIPRRLMEIGINGGWIKEVDEQEVIEAIQNMKANRQ